MMRERLRPCQPALAPDTGWPLDDMARQGGPGISAPQSQGLGSALIEAALPQAKVERRFRPSGVEVVFEVPLD